MSKQKKIGIIISSIILVLLVGALLVFKLNTYSLELNIPAEKTITLEYGVDEMPEIRALIKGSIINRSGKPINFSSKGHVDLDTLGSYEVTYTAIYKDQKLTETRTFVVVDTIAPVIELVSSPEHYTSPVGSYEEEGFTATDNYDGNITASVVSVEKDGVVTYTVADSSGNEAVATRTIIYKDVIAPVITLKKGNNLSINVGKDFKDPGYSAEDECDGDLTKSVKVEGSVDGHKYGTYTLTYTVSDSSGNEAKVERKVTIGDFSAPTLKLKGSSKMYVKIDTDFSDPGYSASDNIDGNLTSKVKVSGSVNTSKMGSYTITYSVSDAAGNTTKKTRSVYVYKKQANPEVLNPGNKVVYLTFDDGPGKYTQKLLNILDKYNVKVTFFVTNQYPDYRYLIGEAHDRGHTIALHAYSHDYSKIYKSENAYYEDLTKIHNICEAQTGVTPSIVRFPGGTSNTISKKYCKGIMSTLASDLRYHGYLYCDWNVSSGDAGGTTSKSGVAKNVINGIKKHNVSYVLQHDIKGFSVDAVEEIILWGMENGYTFLPLTENSPMYHHSPQN